MNASFIETMLLLRKEKLPQGAEWAYEIKLDGYRAIAFKKGGKVQLKPASVQTRGVLSNSRSVQPSR
jgi:hypothetical protein